MTMPGGGGALVALTFKAAIDDPDRFSSSRGVGPWGDLTPQREQSGEHVNIGEISRAGDAGLRTAPTRRICTFVRIRGLQEEKGGLTAAPVHPVYL